MHLLILFLSCNLAERASAGAVSNGAGHGANCSSLNSLILCIFAYCICLVISQNVRLQALYQMAQAMALYSRTTPFSIFWINLFLCCHLAERAAAGAVSNGAGYGAVALPTIRSSPGLPPPFRRCVDAVCCSVLSFNCQIFPLDYHCHCVGVL